MSQARPRRVLVIGGGISGLSVAWFLRQVPDPPQVTVLEAGETVGGKLRAGTLGGFPVDAGAESMLARRPEAVDLVRSSGLADRLEPPATSSARLMVDGTLHDFPSGTVLGVPGDMRALANSRVLTRRGLARARAERALPASAQHGDISVGQYVTTRMGREVTQRLVEPLLGGVYACRSEMLSLEATMPAIAAARAQGELLTVAAARIRHAGGSTAHGSAAFMGIRGGLWTLPPHLAATAGVRVLTATIARTLSRARDGKWNVVIGSVSEPEVLTAEAVVLAVPAGPAARLLRGAAPGAASLLEVVDYASVGLVALAYRHGDVPLGALRGSGHLVPPREGRAVKAVTYSSHKWTWVRESVPGLSVIRSSVGRLGDSADLRRDDADLVRVASEDAADVLGVPARPVAGSVFRWGGSLPQYAVGHASRAAKAHAVVAEQPGLALCGAALDGVGIPACIASARVAADRVLRATAADATMAR